MTKPWLLAALLCFVAIVSLGQEDPSAGQECTFMLDWDRIDIPPGVMPELVFELLSEGCPETVQQPAAEATPLPGPPVGPPIGDIETSKLYTATFIVESGEFKVALFDDDAPLTVENFIKLARSGFYDGTTFHWVIEGFVAMGGDPTGTGAGGVEYRFEDEFSDRKHDSPGVLSMANAGPDTNGSIFFITFAAWPHLDGQHTVFGKVVEGIDVALNIKRRHPEDDEPGEKILTIGIDEVLQASGGQ